MRYKLVIKYVFSFILLSLFIQVNAHSFHDNHKIKIKGKTKSLVIGISLYQDPDIPDMQLAHRDAELFAGYLRTQSPLNLDEENLMLLTNDGATTAQVAAALDWLFEGTCSKDTLILFYSGYGFENGEKQLLTTKPFFNDTPLSVNNAATFDIFNQFLTLANRRNIPYKLITILYPMMLPYDLRDQYRDERNKPVVKNLKNVLLKSTITEKSLGKSIEENSKAKISLGYILIDGMIGNADSNKDMQISFKELELYLSTCVIPAETLPGTLLISTSSRKAFNSRINPKYLNQVAQNDKYLFPSLITSETNLKADELLRKLPVTARLLYQDFIVALKLGHLLTPLEKNAAQLYDSILILKDFEPLHNDLKRKLTIALLDETQQALNAYLNTDSRELTRRETGRTQYVLYAQYLEKALELMGEKHFMHKIIMAKIRYFQGLNQRIEGQKTGNKDHFLEANALQKQALEFEYEAAFIHNEIGVNYNFLLETNLSEKAFNEAIIHAPTWSIPYFNLAILYLDKNPQKAINYAKEAVRLSPKNGFTYNALGMSYFKSHEFGKAETAFTKAIKYDPEFTDAYYNLACLKTKEGDYATAAINLEMAFVKGFIDVNFAIQDEDLTALREQDIWQILMLKYFKKKQ